MSTRQDSDAARGMPRHNTSWSERITVVLRRAAPEDGGYEAVVTQGAPHDARISVVREGHPYDAYALILDVLMRFGFAGEIELEDRTLRGRVRREVLR